MLMEEDLPEVDWRVLLRAGPKKRKKKKEKDAEDDEDEEEEEEVEEEDDGVPKRLRVEGKKPMENFIRIPEDMKEKRFQELSAETLHNMFPQDIVLAEVKYPIMLDFSGPQFQLRSPTLINSIAAHAVKELNISDNSLRKFPEEFFEEFKQLRRLRADKNQIRLFPVVHCFTKLKFLSLSQNELGAVPDLTEMPKLMYLDLSNNKITSISVENVFSCKKLRYLFLESNQIELQQDEFNELIIKFKSLAKSLTHFSLRYNKLDVRQYKEWIFTNLPKLEFFDGQFYDKIDKAEIGKLEDPPSSEDDNVSSSGTESLGENRYTGPRCKTRLWQMTKQLSKCIDNPSDSLTIIRDLQSTFDQHARIDDPRGRELFDEEDEEIVTFASALNKPTEKVEKDLRKPDVIVEEFLMAADAVITSQPTVAPKAIGLLVSMLAISNPPIPTLTRQALEEYLRAGDTTAQMVVDAIVKHTLPRLSSPKTSVATKHVIFQSLHALSRYDVLIEELRPHGSKIGQFLVPTDKNAATTAGPTKALLGFIGACARDSVMAEEIASIDGISNRIKRLLALTQSRFEMRNELMVLIGNTATHSKKFACRMGDMAVHMEVLDEINPMMQGANNWTKEQSDHAASLINCLNGIIRHHERALQDAVSSGFVERLMKLVKQSSIPPQLLTTVLRALGGIVVVAETLEDHITNMGGVAPLLNYIDGPPYDGLCHSVGAVQADGTPIPVQHQSDPQILETVIEIVKFITIFQIRALGPPQDPATKSAKSLSDRLDKAGRESKLFRILSNPRDDVKFAVVRCLQAIPLGNFQPSEVEYLVNLVSRADNLTVGRTEQLIAGILEIFTRLASDTTHIGSRFRKSNDDIIHIILSILTRNASRDTRSQKHEALEKAALSTACTNFLMAASDTNLWPEAADIMASRVSVLAMGEILKYEQLFGQSDYPVMIEKSGCGQTVQSLLTVLPELDVNSFVAKRVLIRIAEVLEGTKFSTNVTDPLIPDIDVETLRAGTRRQQLHEHGMFVQVDGFNLVLKYLNRGIPVRPQVSYETRNVHAFFQTIMSEELSAQRNELLDSGTGNTNSEVQRDGLHYLIVENESLHDPRTLIGLTPTVKSPFDVAVSKHQVENPACGTVAAALRVFGALLMYGNSVTRGKALKTSREVDFIRMLVSLCDAVTQGDWHQHGVGANVLTIITELISLPTSKSSETDAVIPIYDVCCQVFYRMINVLDPLLSEIIYDRNRGTNPRSLDPSIELLFQKLARAMLVVVTSLQYIRPTNDSAINETCQDNLLMSLIDLRMIRCMVHYLFYDRVITTTTWNDTDNLAVMRLRTREYVTRFVCEYLHVNDELRFRIMEIFNRMEIQHHLPLRASFTAHLLEIVKSTTFSHNLERYMQDKQLFPKDPERVIFCNWLMMDELNDDFQDIYVAPVRSKTLKIVGDITGMPVSSYAVRPPRMERRLLVITNQAYYAFSPAEGMPCGACDEAQFCPTGPVLLMRMDFKSIERIMCSVEGHRCVVEYSWKEGSRGKAYKAMAFSTMEHGLLIQFARALHDLYPLKPKPPLRPTVIFDNGLISKMDGLLTEQRNKLKKGKKKQEELDEDAPKEQFLGFVGCWRELSINGGPKQRVERWALVSNSHFYLIVENTGIWLEDVRRERQRQIELRQQAKLEEAEAARIEKLKRAGIVVQKQEESNEERASRLQREKAEKAKVAQMEANLEKIRPPYTAKEEEVPIPAIKELQFSHGEQPTVTIKKPDDGTITLYFSSDPGREHFRLLMKKSMNLTVYTRDFVVAGHKAEGEKDPEHVVKI
eukprot:c8073_g1_i1.p1 GENE.c8073_g1_i1~~c8073_g1_i1.p1  ORF type:complete len:1809 (-),score=303.36 c8073_g1_i1:50-5449(-)